jgi:hypothetical protein
MESEMTKHAIGAAAWLVMALGLGDGGAAAQSKKPLTQQEKLEIDEALADVLVGAASLRSLPQEEQEERTMKAEMATKQLLEFTGERPEAMDYLRPSLQKLPKGPDAKDVRTRLAMLLVRDEDASSVKVCGELVAAEPELFDDAALVALAERGAKVAEKPLRRLLAAGEFDFGQIYPAAYFAFRGDAAGRKVLDHVVGDADFAHNHPDAEAACAAALAALGDRTPWHRCVDRQLEELRPLQHADPDVLLRNAVWIILRLEYFQDALDRRRPPSLAFMSTPVDRYTQLHESEIASLPDAESRMVQLKDSARASPTR